jgi:hypothetical protein
MIPGDPWALVHNPSILSLTPETRVSAFMVPALFGIRELQTVSSCGTFSLAGGPVSLSVEQFGFDLYKEFCVTAGFGRTIAKGISGGLALEWRKTAIKGYGTSHSFVVAAGWVVELSEELHMGFAGDNILGETIGNLRQPLPQKVAMAISYQPLSDLLFVLEGEKDTKHPMTARTGLEFSALESLRLRMGVAHDPNIVSAGISIQYGGAEFGYAAFGHAQLGWTHCIEASMRLGD